MRFGLTITFQTYILRLNAHHFRRYRQYFNPEFLMVPDFNAKASPLTMVVEPEGKTSFDMAVESGRMIDF